MAAIGSDPAAILVVVAIVLFVVVLLGMVFTARARRRARQRETEQMTPASADEVAIARWVEEGRHLLNHWQERIERLDALQSRLAAMAQEIGQLTVQVSRMEAVQAENVRLVQKNEALLLERDHVRAVLARIGELIQQASVARPRAAGEAAPGVGP
jgi:regulator of replication initiation timing